MYASTAEKSNIEVTAKHVEGSNTTLYAKDGVVVYYRDSVIHADSAVYDKLSHRLVLDGNVEMIGYQGTKEHTSHMEINTETDTIAFKELFFTNENDIWLLSNDATRTKSIYTFGQSMLSSCDINDPLWKMHFSSSVYDAEEKYMKLYNTSVYFGDIPVFYTPYLAFSTSKERSSGLLFPLLGYTQDEGFVYEQPIYWAISKSVDLEINPQIRTDRSLGIYGTLRFADSPYSEGRLRIGYFRDKDSYLEENNLVEDEHYGLEFLYNSSQVFSQHLSGDYTDGLYANITLLNDIEYLNLQKTHLKHFGQVPLQESRVNYFLYNDDWYGGLNAKYFIDTRLPDNDTTLQTLPALQFHKYLKSIGWDNLTYSLDLQTKHLDRKTGPTLNQVEMRVPIEFTASFLDDFLNVTLGEQLYYGRFSFANDDTLPHDYFQYYSNVHTAKLFSDLTGKYDGFTHVLQPSVGYIKPGSENQSPLNFEELLTDQPQVKDLFSVGLPEEQFVFSLNQYFYDENMKLIFFQRLTQSYYQNREYELADLKNEMGFNWKNWSLYSNLYYSFEFDDISESSTTISLKEPGYKISVGHTFKQLLTDTAKTVTANDISFDFQYEYNERVAINGGMIYDVEEGTSRLWRVGGSYTRDCWSVAASVSADVRPRPSTISGVTDYTQEYGFFLQLNFIPFASINSAQLDTLVATP
jgi:LPS-assembly protein